PPAAPVIMATLSFSSIQTASYACSLPCFADRSEVVFLGCLVNILPWPRRRGPGCIVIGGGRGMPRTRPGLAGRACRPGAVKAGPCPAALLQRTAEAGWRL